MRYTGLLVLALALPTVAYATLVNINTADAALLETLSGIGPSKAAAIVEYRSEHGPFATTEDIQKVSGIGPVTFANLKESITVGSIPPAGGQPPVPVTSYRKVQAVEPAQDISTSGTAHEDTAVSAPAAETELAAAGAALPALPPNNRSSGLWHSIWTLGLLVVIIVAGGAFVFI